MPYHIHKNEPILKLIESICPLYFGPSFHRNVNGENNLHYFLLRALTRCDIKISYTAHTPKTVIPCSLHSIATATSKLKTGNNLQSGTKKEKVKFNFHLSPIIPIWS